METIEKLAREFHKNIREVLSKDELRNVDEQNSPNDPCCATHDFVDANTYMDEAFSTVYGRGFDWDGEPHHESDFYAMNEAWSMVKKKGFANEWK